MGLCSGEERGGSILSRPSDPPVGHTRAALPAEQRYGSSQHRDHLVSVSLRASMWVPVSVHNAGGIHPNDASVQHFPQSVSQHFGMLNVNLQFPHELQVSFAPLAA